MRLDKFFSNTATLSRSECAKACRAGLVSVDGTVIKDPSFQVDPEKNAIAYKGERINYKEYIYIMLNKPEGYVCSNDEPGGSIVFELIDQKLLKLGLFVCGRLDKDTTGLVIITNDGVSAHNALSPKRHVSKEYEFALADPISEADLDTLRGGATLADGTETLPCEIKMTGEKEGIIILHEGKYHQIKRMFASVGNKIVRLARTKFGGISLDPSLPPGKWRYLTEQEETVFAENNKKTY